MRVLLPLPTHDYEPTETSVPWRALRDAGHEVVFATPDGAPARPDPRVLTGRGFGPWRPFLRATRHARSLHDEMAASDAFHHPLPHDALAADDFDAVVVTGGHAPGMRTLFESAPVQRLVAAHMLGDKPVGAICHGVLVVARAQDPATGRSVLHGRRTTALLKSQELTAWGMTALWLGSYYRTYPTPVQAEVTAALASPRDFVPGPFTIRREGPARPRVGFVVRDGNYVSARYYVDTYRFARELVALLAECDQRLK